MKKTILLRLASSLAALVVGASMAQADSIKFCLNGEGTFVDNGFQTSSGLHEDTWWTDAYRDLLGARVKVKIGSTTYFDGNLGDGFLTGDPGWGCTPTLSVPNANSSYTFYYYSVGTKIDRVGGGQHTLDIYHYPSPISIHQHNVAMTYSHSGGEGTFQINLVANDEIDKTMRMHAAITRTLRTAAKYSPSSISIDAYLDEVNQDSARWDDDNIWIGSSDTDSLRVHRRKFLMAHETGHAIANALGQAVGGDCSHSDSQCPAGGSHGMTSKEYQTCAFTEGLANFMSVVAFNSENETDCFMRYWGNFNVDCESTSTHSNAYMENACYSTSHTDKGVELDWMKQFWDVFTNSNGVLNMDHIGDWLAGATNVYPFVPWIDPYEQLDAAADNIGGTLNTNWDTTKGANGVDW